MDNTSPLGFLMFCHSCVLYFYRCHQKIWWKKFFLQRGPSCFVAARSQIGKMQYKVWPLRLLHCSGLVWVFSGEIPTHFSTFGRKQPRTTVWANYPFKYLHISLLAFFRSPAVHYGGKRTLKRWREGYLPSPWTTLPDPTKQICLCPR